MLKESQLFSLLDKVLNQTSYIRKGEEAVFFCPFCHHYKQKLEVNVRTQEWHCWVCHAAGQSIRSLFYKIKAKESAFTELYKIIGKEWKRPDEEKKFFNRTLPDEFIPLWKKSGVDYGHAMAYLDSRNITMDDILRYNIGYCEEGEYAKRIIIPSFDKNGDINFFSARAYHEGNSQKYMLPPWDKNVIGFDLFVNWGYEYVTMTEGTFDAIAIRNNVIPMFGTTMSGELQERIITSGIPRFNLVLDSDEAGIRGALRIYDYFQGYDIAIHLIILGDKDPSTIGFHGMSQIIDTSKPTDFSEIIRIKLNYQL
jgi:DNA primase